MKVVEEWSLKRASWERVERENGREWYVKEGSDEVCEWGGSGVCEWGLRVRVGSEWSI